MNNLKTIAQIAEAVNLHPDRIRDLIRKEEIKPAYTKPYRLDEYQQDYIYRIIYLEQRTDYITLPSKMNTPNPEPDVIYSDRENFISAGHIIRK